jgi:hypothetical protein
MLNRVFATVLSVSVILTAASPALATSCQQWRRMGEDQRWDRVYRMIDDAIAGQRGRQYQANRAAIGRCLERQVESMYYDFDDTCAEAETAGSQAINRIFKSYIWSCFH